MNAAFIQEKLDESGEIMVKVHEFEEPIELHLHDTEIEDDLVTLELDDGVLWFSPDEVTGVWKHYHSTDDYGL